MTMVDTVANELVKLNKVRLSFPQLFEAKQYVSNGVPGGKPRFSATFMIEPGDANFKAINAAIDNAAKGKFKDKWEKKLAGLRGNSNKFCFVDGDTKDDERAEGKWILTSHRNEDQGRPGVYDKNRAPLTAADGKPYAGCYVNAMVEIWAQEGENAGIRCKLLAVQFAGDGEAFGGGRKPKAEDFEVLEDEEALA